MANCNESKCKDKLKELHDARETERASWRRLMTALALAGFTGGGTITVIGVWLGKKLAEAGAATLFPGIGWAFAGATAVLLIAAATLWGVWKSDKNHLESIIDEMQEACDVECWPSYAR